MIDSKKLKAKMVLEGFTQEMLATKIGMNVSTISLKINGKRTFTIEEANKIAAFLHLTGDECNNIFFASVVA